MLLNVIRGSKFVSLVLSCFLSFLTLSVLLRNAGTGRLNRFSAPSLSPESKVSLDRLTDPGSMWHPINTLLAKAEKEFRGLISKQSSGVSEAAKAYRKRRKRHPPPDFDRWVAFAEAHDCVIVEDFFDQIYHDLNPFWGLPAEHIRAGLRDMPDYISVRDGKASKTGNKMWINTWIDMIRQLETVLPDVDIPINSLDEPRVMVPWETIASYMKTQTASLARQDLSRPPQINAFKPYSLHEGSMPSTASWVTEGSYWEVARHTCPPETQGRVLKQDVDFSMRPVFPEQHPYGSYHGYVSNWTVAKDFCGHTHLRNLHATFVAPETLATSVTLLPLFGSSKHLMNNEILIPPAVHWSEDPMFALDGIQVPWREKKNEVIWRGTAGGGHNTEDNWTRFHRHRLVSMMNATTVGTALEREAEIWKDQEATVDDSIGGPLARDSSSSSYTSRSGVADREATNEFPFNFPLPNDRLYPLKSHSLGLLPQWIAKISDIAFGANFGNFLKCSPESLDGYCPYTSPWYSRGSSMPLSEMFEYKYLIDIDGNSFSGRFRAFLQSNSLPIKAALYSEWHDSRLVPWKHFVPMDNTFMDLWSLLEYFSDERNDKAAEAIALSGQEWAEKVLRKEDMLVYVYRLLLEFARLLDDKRDEMGYGGDL